MKRTLKDRQDMCQDLYDACQIDPTLLEVVCDEYIYRLNDKEMDELEEIIFNTHQHILGGTSE
jgi:isocitrate dehydrogenase kinase/phosphatase